MARFIISGFSEDGRLGSSKILYDGPDLEAGKSQALRSPGIKSIGYLVDPVWVPIGETIVFQKAPDKKAPVKSEDDKSAIKPKSTK